MTQKPETLLWLTDARGIYIPRDFANSFADRATHVRGVDAGQWETLESGPDHQDYWETWTEVCDNAIVTDDDGVKYRLHQDGDLWLVPDGMVWDDRTECFAWEMEEEE